jgi:aspartyl-tRNA(Asn)/glutamyl-tRNA(Gln) amidotransferase subunit C
MKINREDVLRVAELAQLELTPDEVVKYQGQLDKILEYIGKLNELNVSKVEPMAQVLLPEAEGDTPSLRPDEPRPCNTAQEILKNAPDAARPFFRVPKVIER